MLYVRVHPIIGCCKLCFKCGCSCVDRPGWGRVDESSCVRGNYTALNTHMSDYAVKLAHESQATLNQLGCEVCDRATSYWWAGRGTSPATSPVEQVVYSCMWEGMVKSPFCVIVDRFKNAIVVAIRGTLSLADALQDADAAPERLAAVFGEGALS